MDHHDTDGYRKLHRKARINGYQDTEDTRMPETPRFAGISWRHGLEPQGKTLEDYVECSLHRCSFSQ